ncbi:MAG: metal transporter [Longimicrobiales bacterium]
MPETSSNTSLWVRALFPLALLAILVVILLRHGPLGMLESGAIPVEDLVIERITLPEPNVMKLRVVNGGAEPVTIAQITIDDAAWVHTLDGDRRMERLSSRVITIPYPWVTGERHVVKLVTSTGVTFESEVQAAVQTPRAGAKQIGMFAVLGIYVGVIPVLLGLLWLPFLRRVEHETLDFFLAFTVGLLLFLGIEAMAEALDMSQLVPGAYQGLGIVMLGSTLTALLLFALGRADSSRTQTGEGAANRLALLVAIGIGLHNLGEGLAVGSAYATGEIALGTFLVLGFLLHNTTEGLAIVTPLASGRPRVSRLIGLGLLAGLPTIAGAWIGGLSYSPVLTTLFFAIGAGAIAQVIYAIASFFAGSERGLTSPRNAAGFALGMLVMYATGLFVAA